MITSNRLYAVTPTGPQVLQVPADNGDVNELFDHLPLGIYEGLRTFDHVRLVGLEEHLERAETSMRRLGWTEPFDRAALRQSLAVVLHDFPEPDARVRFDVLAKPAPALGTESRVLIALSPLVPVVEELLRDGAGVQLVRDLSRPSPLAKTADFVLARRAYPQDGRDAYEAMMVGPSGCILEGTSSNFFAVENGVLRTAGADVLEGITARFVIELAKERGIKVRMEAVQADERGGLEESFLSSSVRSIVPIVRIDGEPVGAGRPGPITRGLMEAYRAFAERTAVPVEPPSRTQQA